MLKNFNISKGWVKIALSISTKDWNKWLVKCGIDWESTATRSEVVEEIEDLLRRLCWDEVKMCEEMFRFIGIDVDDFRKYGVEPCAWLSGLKLLSSLRNPYWLGLRASDLSIKKFSGAIRLELDTTSSIDAIFFPKILSTVTAPSLRIVWKRRTSTVKYIDKTACLQYYIDLGINEWPWPIELSAGELERILDGFTDEEIAMFVAGLIDGDGFVRYDKDSRTVYVGISACKDCPKRANLNIVKRVIAKRFGIIGSNQSGRTTNDLVFGGEDTIRLLRRVAKYIHHPLRRLRAELILALYDGRISREAFEKLYETTEYELGGPDIKRNHDLEVLARAAPQTHTHGIKQS
jgi:hypothetical protein